MRYQILITNVLNGNGRIFSKKVTEEIISQINAEDLNFGELGHSDDAIVNLANVSHEYKDGSLNENILEVDINILETPMGKILKENLDQFVFRVKGLGIVDETGKVNDYTLLSIDAVLKENDPWKNIINS